LVEVSKTYVAVVAIEKNQWLASIEGLPVHTYSDTPEGLLKAIHEALSLYLDTDDTVEVSLRGESVDEREARFKDMQDLT
jgi:predicted RNase H-like HicB family nuclease